MKGLKNAESQTRAKTMIALRGILAGLSSSATICHRDVYKAAKSAMTDRSMFVRAAASQVKIQ